MFCVAGASFERARARAGSDDEGHVRQRVVHRGRSRHRNPGRAARVRGAVPRVRAPALERAGAAHGADAARRPPRQRVYGARAQLLQRHHQGRAVNAVTTL